MSKVDICGLGAWGPTFADWPSFCHGLQSGEWSTDVLVQPDLIPPRERRRAPQFVKMAIEVMHQACEMATINPSDVAVVFSSAMGDMQITDYLCRALAETPKIVSPTRFHNSVHNAAPGYWSIATGAHSPTTAVSAHQYTASIAFVEAAIQVIEEDTPVVLVTQELAAPLPLFDSCPSEQTFSAAFLMTPPGHSATTASSVEFSISQTAARWPEADSRLERSYANNFGARFLPLLIAIADGEESSNFDFPISDSASLSLSLKPGRHSLD